MRCLNGEIVVWYVERASCLGVKEPLLVQGAHDLLAEVLDAFHAAAEIT